MERLQICKICRKNIAQYNCKLCGAYVCSDCYKDGLCADCKKKRFI